MSGSSGKKWRVMVVLAALLALAGVVVLIAGCGGSSTTTAPATTTSGAATTTSGAVTTTSGAATTGTTAADKAVTLSMVCFLDKTHDLAQPLNDWIKDIETATNGTVKINWKGGPEVIPALEQIEAVRTGVVDVLANVSAYYAQLNPALQVLTMSPFSPAEERENGVFDFIQREHAAIDTVYVGRWMGELPFYLFVNKPIATSAELKGVSLRTRANYDRFFKALGVSGVSVDTGEVYTALERGIVQGFGWTLLGVTDLNWDTKAPYMIDEGFWGANNATLLFNPKSWAALSANQQQAILKATADFEMDQMIPYFVKAQKEARAELAGRGVTFIKFSDADAAAFLALADQVEWDALKAQLPDKFAEIQKLFNLK